MSTSRRAFLATAAAAQFVGWSSQDPAPRSPEPVDLPRRLLGRTGLQVPILGLGTYPLGTMPDEQEDAAIAVIARAFELGVRYFDTAPSYDNHRAERRLGKALKGKRDEIVLATKSVLLPAAKALAELDDSLRALGTDHVDIFQIHAIGDEEDRKRKLDAEHGVLAAALAAQKAGKCKHIGFTGHAEPAVLAQCLDAFQFATVLAPVNCADPLWVSFVQQVLPKAKAKGTAVVAMKVFAAGQLAGADAKVTAAECVRWALSQDVAVAVPGCRTIAELEVDVAAVRPFVPMSADEQRAVTERVGAHPGNALEWYKKDRGGK